MDWHRTNDRVATGGSRLCMAAALHDLSSHGDAGRLTLRGHGQMLRDVADHEEAIFIYPDLSTMSSCIHQEIALELKTLPVLRRSSIAHDGYI